MRGGDRLRAEKWVALICHRKSLPPCSESSRGGKIRGHWEELHLGIKFAAEKKEAGFLFQICSLFEVRGPVGGWHYVTLSFVHIAVLAAVRVRPTTC